MSDEPDLMRELDEAEAVIAAQDCEHVYAARHQPGHLVYWVRICMICHKVDWDDLDREIRLGVAEALSDPAFKAPKAGWYKSGDAPPRLMTSAEIAELRNSRALYEGNWDGFASAPLENP